MKEIIIICLCFLYTQMSYAEKVPENVAISVAINFFKQKSNKSERHVQIKDIKDVYYEGLLTTSVVNFENGGWMIVARDDRSIPVLAYNLSGQFDLTTSNKANTARDDFLEHYNQTIYHKAVIEKGNLQKNVKWDKLERMDFSKSRTFDTPVPPLLANSSNWSYWSPYWAGLPGYLNNVNTCMPMAIAQFVKFWNYPTRPRGIESYNTKNNDNQPVTLSIDFDIEEPYNFDIMPYALTDPEFPYTPYFDENSPEAMEIGRLQYHGWFIAHMENFTENNWGGSFFELAVGDRLVSHFGYKSDFELVSIGQNSSEINRNIFKNKIRTDLDKAFPVLASWNGHVFLIDGYQDDGTGQGNYDYFHLVLGWGIDEGYYYFFAEDDDGQHNYPEGAASERYKAFFNLVPSNDPCFLEPEQRNFIISAGEYIIWDEVKNGIESIEIESGGELIIQSDVAFATDGIIIVNRGARLVVDGCKLTTCNGEQWTGIKLHGNAYLPQPFDPHGSLEPYKSGIVIFEDAVVENAYQVVSCDNEYLGNWQARAERFGGLVIGENSTFRNGFRGVEFMQYYPENKSYFDGCIFDNLDLGVTVWNNDEIAFNNCTFSNISRDAIYGIDAGVKVLKGNTFRNCNYGIRNLATAAGMSGLKIGDPDTYGNVFEDCDQAIYMSQQDDKYGLVDVANNYFIDNWNDIQLYGENSYSIYQNDFYKGNGEEADRFSVFGRATGFDANDINCNYFQSIGRKDIMMAYQNDLTTFLGNDFSVINDNFTLYGHQLDPTQPGTILPVIGSRTEPSRNCFNGDDIITYNNTDSFDYWFYTMLPCEEPLNEGSYNPEATDNYFIKCGQGTGSGPVTEQQAQQWIEDYCERIYITELPDPDKYEEYLKELELFKRKYFRILGKYLKLLGEENQDQKIKDILDMMCDCESKRKLFGFYLKRGRFAEARTTLERDMCDSTKRDTIFREIQTINLKWNEELAEDRLYYPSPSEIEFLKTIALSAFPESGSAQALLYLLTGQWEQAPMEDLERSDRFVKTNEQSTKNVQLFPNPANDELFILLTLTDNQNYTLYIYDALGNLVQKEIVESSVTNRIDITTLNTGNYFCIVRDGKDHAVLEEKVIIQR